MDAAAVSQVNAMVEAVTAPARIRDEAGTAVLRRAMDMASAQMTALLGAMPPASAPGAGRYVDVSA